jgi:glycogen(starch) synthase
MTPSHLPRRILMTTDAVGGVWNYALELCRGLGRSGVEVTLASMGPRPSADQRAAVAALRNVTLHESEYRLEWMEDPWDDVRRAGEWLLELEWACAPDIVHVNGFVHGALPWRAPCLVVAHSCVLSWWEAVRREPVPARWNRYRAAVTHGLRSAGLVVAPSRAMFSALERHYGLTRGLVIPNGRAASDFDCRAPKERVVLTVGRVWDEAKNIESLVDVAPQLDWAVHVVGDQTSPAGENWPLTGVTTLGRCAATTVAQLYARAGIYALPARYEPFGLSVLEAALAGCALVLGDVPSLREIWGPAAVYIPPHDRATLRDAINGLIRDPVHRRQLAEHARERAGYFTAERMTARYLDVYQELTARPARRSAVSVLSA